MQLKRVILRTLMCSGIDYANHLAKIKDWQDNEVDKTNIADAKALGDRIFWLVEISVPDLFSANRRKIGEILLDASCLPTPSNKFRNFELARLSGGFYTLYSKRTKTELLFGYTPCTIMSHVELYGCEGTK